MDAQKRWKKSRPNAYKSWDCMKQRCDDPKHMSYHRYGGRGITYDPRWDKFKEFFADMGERPKDYQLDRIDNDGGYCKENCRWVTRSQNQRNKGEGTASSNYSGHKGVSQSKNKKKWRARISIDGKHVTLGTFDTVEEASSIYQQAVKDLQ